MSRVIYYTVQLIQTWQNCLKLDSHW